MGQKHILVVDDHAKIRDVVGNSLRREDYAVTVAVDGQEALHLLEHCTPDLVLTDLYMPRCDGMTLVRHINTAWPTLPVILWTIEDRLDAEELARHCRVDALLTKPVDLHAMLACVARVLA